jgi:hypothetical protein
MFPAPNPPEKPGESAGGDFRMNRKTRTTSGEPRSSLEPDGKEKRYVLTEERRAAVETVFDRFLAGDGIASIAKSLNAAGTRPWSGAAEWSPGEVRKILTDPALTGKGALRPETGEEDGSEGGGCPQVISEERFAEVQSRLAGKGPREGLMGQITRRVGGCLNPSLD